MKRTHQSSSWMTSITKSCGAVPPRMPVLMRLLPAVVDMLHACERVSTCATLQSCTAVYSLHALQTPVQASYSQHIDLVSARW